MNEAESAYGVSYNQVAAAADAITSEGKKPTLRAVRERLGTGSMATIQKHLGSWRSQGREIVTTHLTLSEGTQRAILGEIERQVADARAKLEEELTVAKADRDALSEEGERQNDRIAAQASDMERMRAEMQRQKGVLEQVREEMEHARITAKAETSAARADAERWQSEAQGLLQEVAMNRLRLEAVPRMEEEMQRLKDEIKAEQMAGGKAAKEAAVAAERIQGLDTRIADFQKRDADALQRLAEVRDDLEVERVKCVTAQQAAAVCAQKTEHLEFRIAELLKKAQAPA